ncbi:uncharacterized protein LOC123264559 [Cotesia glomerata]|uniref:Uncharacterized protein n=1 Tax=Cotesia glomerata TaxID=32391 RepID=A0AAV7IXG0_COTGL|nr:uncharacterized protein LOC123264559 [Cotesia glomerata]KAH0560670.1 hypothetical protein KQX54_006833 [Cotesia glomerata]
MILYKKSYLISLLILWINLLYCICDNVIKKETESTLEKLVKLFTEPGAFKRVGEILGENSIESVTCANGDEGLDCRRAEARRSVDCPDGDCYCYNCSLAGPELWASCCRESSKCCSYLAAACRNCDQPSLFSFCSKHFKKCLNELRESDTATTTSGTPTM